MAIKIFQNAFSGNANDSIAINSDHVMSVFETKSINPDTGDEEVLTNIFSVSGNTWQVKDKYLEVIARLNENVV
jgi:hypothetical protein